jgi:hypothetical protein
MENDNFGVFNFYKGGWIGLEFVDIDMEIDGVAEVGFGLPDSLDGRSAFGIYV